MSIVDGMAWEREYGCDKLTVSPSIEEIRDAQITALMLENAMWRSRYESLNRVVQDATRDCRGCPSDKGYEENCSKYLSCDECWFATLKLNTK